MKDTKNLRLTALVCALALTSSLSATMLDESAVAKRVQTENVRMEKVRAAYPAFFASAYQQFPEIPAGVLEAIAYSKTRWNPVVPDTNGHADSGHMAKAFGVMALFDGATGFQNQIRDAAQLLGVSEHQVKFDTETNIRAQAALLARDMRGAGLKRASTPEQLSQVLALSLGLERTAQKSNAHSFAEESFAFGVLSALNQGADDHGVRLKARAIAFEKAFSVPALVRQRASFVRLDVSKDRIETNDFRVDVSSETLQSMTPINQAKSLDYGPALFQQSPNERARTVNPTNVVIHQMEGFYAGSIATFLVVGGTSAHYLIRDSDGQVTQMVRESRAGSHIASNNNYTIGIEQEGFRGQSNWYSDANYREVIAITKSICTRWTIACTSVFRGTATDTENVQATTMRIKGHQHYPDQAGQRTDPGRFFNWTRFANGIGGSTAFTGVLDDFETSEGRFNTEPAVSGSTVGIASSSSAERNSTRVKNGAWSEQIALRDNTATSANWKVRFLSGSGDPAQNRALQKGGGRLGFWAYTAAPGVTVQMGVDDSDGTEISTAKSLPTNAWTYFEWKLDDQTQWDAWVNGNGIITANTVTLDAIWFNRAQNANDVFIYIDDVRFVIQ
jgi:N-acetyl-anhydromuramyl-L-alanine amidase AmpD